MEVIMNKQNCVYATELSEYVNYGNEVAYAAFGQHNAKVYKSPDSS